MLCKQVKYHFTDDKEKQERIQEIEVSARKGSEKQQVNTKHVFYCGVNN